MLHMQNDANDPGGKGKRTRQTRETTSAMTPSRQRRVRESHFSGVVSLRVRDNGENDGGGSDDGNTGANWKLTAEGGKQERGGVGGNRSMGVRGMGARSAMLM